MARKACCRFFISLWLACFCGVVWARSFSDVVRESDYGAVGTALSVAVIASFIRTTLTLANPKTVVLDELRQSWRDLVFALVAGGVAHVIVEVARAVWWPNMPDIVRYAFILFAGAQRVTFLQKANKFVDRISDSAADRAVSLVQSAPTEKSE